MSSPNPPIHHKAIALTGIHAPLTTINVATKPPAIGDLLIQVLFTNTGPLDLHQADGGLLANHHHHYPQLIGNGLSGKIVAIGPPPSTAAGSDGVEVEAWRRFVGEGQGQGFKKGDLVFGFTFAADEEKANQEFVTCKWYSMARVPTREEHGDEEEDGEWMKSLAATSPNFVTAVHTLTEDLQMDLAVPLSRPSQEEKEEGEEGKNVEKKKKEKKEKKKEDPILVWGGSSSVGMFIIQMLAYSGYTNIIAVAGKKHHRYLVEKLGARICVDYQDDDVVEKVRTAAAACLPQGGDGGDREQVEEGEERNKYVVVDCIGSLEGSLKPLTKIVGKGSLVAVMLPVIVTHASEETRPSFEMDVQQVLKGEWMDGVTVKGTRTFMYQKNEFLRYNLQPFIMPTLLGNGDILPTPTRLVEGATMLERAEKALAILRRGEVSGERLVWKVSEEV